MTYPKASHHLRAFSIKVCFRQKRKVSALPRPIRQILFVPGIADWKVWSLLVVVPPELDGSTVIRPFPEVGHDYPGVGVRYDDRR
jgi:hypothetical protein